MTASARAPRSSRHSTRAAASEVAPTLPALTVEPVSPETEDNSGTRAVPSPRADTPQRSEPPPANRKAVYTIIDQDGRHPRWVRIGIAFVNRDLSLNVVLDALPVNGTLHIRNFPVREVEEGNND